MTFGRYFRPSATITIGSIGIPGITISDINLPPPAPRGPRMAFRVKRTIAAEPDECDVSITNLSPEREKSITSVFNELGRASLSVFAGYESSISRLFEGDIRSMRAHQRQGPDYSWVASADDGGDALSDLTISYFTAGWTAANMIDLAVAALAAGDPIQGIAPYPLAKDASVARTIAAAGPDASGTLFSGAHVGKVADLLNEAARLCKARWWIADGLLYMTQRRLPTDNLAVLLRSQVWQGEPNDDGSGLVRLPVFFDPRIVPGRQVQLVDERPTPRFAAPLFYRTEAVEHTGDTRSGPWVSDLTLRRFP